MGDAALGVDHSRGLLGPLVIAPPAFVEAVSVRWFDFGRGPTVVRVDHPAMPGRPVIGVAEPGLPESGLQAKAAACIVALHADFTTLSQDFDIL